MPITYVDGKFGTTSPAATGAAGGGVTTGGFTSGIAGTCDAPALLGGCCAVAVAAIDMAVKNAAAYAEVCRRIIAELLESTLIVMAV
jgi:hypothetical protein